MWMWSDPYFLERSSGDEVAILLVDTQGMFDHETTVGLTAAIFGLSTLLSSYQIYNVDKRIQEDNLQQLALFSEYGRMAFEAEEKAAAMGVAGEGGDDKGETTEEKTASSSSKKTVSNKQPFQKIEFLVRDWQNFDTEDEEDIASMEAEMASYLEHVTAEDPDDSWGEEWTDEDERALDDEEAERRKRLLAVANKSTEPTVDTVIFDTELTPRQNRNIEQFLDGKVQVCDRTMLILDIFSQRARTAEGQLQVEMAQLEYQLPRLSRMWTHLERQTGGGGAGGQVKGMGEKQIEIDKRLLRDRIQFLKKKVDKVKTHRSLYRERRKETPVPVISLVGYTNAGKSSLLNVLTAAEVYAENQLFATLDPTTRRFPLPNGKEVLVTDTVGFIQNLPTELVAAFRATLEEIVDSTMLIHVVDISSPLAGAQVAAVESVLKDLGASDIPRVTVWNKADARPGVEDLNILAKEAEAAGAVATSALTGFGIEDLVQTLQETLVQVALVRIEIDVPYDSGSIIGEVRKSGVVESEVYGQDGTRVVAHVPPPTARRLAHLAVKGDSMSSMETLDVGVVQEKEEWSREDEEAFLALTLEEGEETSEL